MLYITMKRTFLLCRGSKNFESKKQFFSIFGEKRNTTLHSHNKCVNSILKNKRSKQSSTVSDFYKIILTAFAI